MIEKEGGECESDKRARARERERERERVIVREVREEILLLPKLVFI